MERSRRSGRTLMMKHLVAAPRKAGASHRNNTDVVATCFHGMVARKQPIKSDTTIVLDIQVSNIWSPVEPMVGLGSTCLEDSGFGRGGGGLCGKGLDLLRWHGPLPQALDIGCTRHDDMTNQHCSLTRP